MDHVIVRFDGAVAHLGDVVHEQNALAAHLEAVRRFVDLGSHAPRSIRGERLPIAVVASEHSEKGHAFLVIGSEAERRAVVAGVHHDADAFGTEALEEAMDCRHSIVRVSHHSDAHYTYLHSGWACSLRTRSS